MLEGKDLSTGFQGEPLPEVLKMDSIEELGEFNNQLADEAKKHLWVRIVGGVLEEKQTKKSQTNSAQTKVAFDPVDFTVLTCVILTVSEVNENWGKQLQGHDQ